MYLYLPLVGIHMLNLVCKTKYYKTYYFITKKAMKIVKNIDDLIFDEEF